MLRSREEFRHANDDENDLGDLLCRCIRDWNAHTCSCAPQNMEWLPVRLDRPGWKMRALSMERRTLRLGWMGWWLEHLEWMPGRLHDSGWTLRTLSMGMVKQAATLGQRRTVNFDSELG